jgi:hypothetical protein
VLEFRLVSRFGASLMSHFSAKAMDRFEVNAAQKV